MDPKNLTKEDNYSSQKTLNQITHGQTMLWLYALNYSSDPTLKEVNQTIKGPKKLRGTQKPKNQGNNSGGLDIP